MKNKKQIADMQRIKDQVYPTKYGFETFNILPVKVINGCVSTVRS